MSNNILLSPYNQSIANVMFEVKINELSEVANKYGIPFSELKETAHAELSKSNMKTGGCNTALDFLIVDTLNKNNLYKSVEIAIKENILASAIYYANVVGRSEFV